MDISKVISISGMPGLYKVVAQANNGFIVESLIDGKRSPAYSHYRISGLEDISIFTTGDDIPLKDVFQKMFDKQKGAPAIDHKAKDEDLKKFFETVLPEYDKERVHVSDIRKAIQWYNALQKTDLLTAEPETKTEAEEENKEKVKLSASEEKAKKATAATRKPKAAATSAKQPTKAAPKVKAAGVRKTGGGA